MLKFRPSEICLPSLRLIETELGDIRRFTSVNIPWSLTNFQPTESSSRLYSLFYFVQSVFDFLFLVLLLLLSHPDAICRSKWTLKLMQVFRRDFKPLLVDLNVLRNWFGRLILSIFELLAMDLVNFVNVCSENNKSEIRRIQWWFQLSLLYEGLEEIVFRYLDY